MPENLPAIVEEKEACKVRDTDDDETAEATGQATSTASAGAPQEVAVQSTEMSVLDRCVALGLCGVGPR